MQIPILQTIDTTLNDYRTRYPLNMMVIPKQTGISDAYLACTLGIQKIADTPGADRGAIWHSRLNTHFRVIGDALYSVDPAGVLTRIAGIAGTDYTPMAYGFTQLGIVGNSTGYSYDGTTMASGLSLQSDPSIKYNAIDVAWVNQFFFWTDGDQILQSTLSNPLSIQGFADAEAAPDRILGLVATRDELLVCGRHTIERFRNVGTGTFTFRSVAGGVVDKGIVGTNGKVRIGSTFAFVGGGQDENVSVWVFGSNPEKIATRDIEKEIAAVDATRIKLDYYTDALQQILIMNLPNGRIFCYDMATQKWHERTGQTLNPVWYSGKWWVGSTKLLGALTESIGTDWGKYVARQWGTTFLPADKSMRIGSLELKGVWGHFVDGSPPQVEFQITFDGINWSQWREYRIGRAGMTDFRPRWRNIAFVREQRAVVMQFRVRHDQRFSVAALELL